MEAKRKEERHLKIEAALEAKKAPKTPPQVGEGRSPFEVRKVSLGVRKSPREISLENRLREAKTYKEYKALKLAFKAKEGP